MRYKIHELQELKDSFSSNRILLEEKLLKLNSTLKNIDDILNAAGKSDKNLEVILQENLIDYDFKIETTENVRWKKEIFEIILASNYFLSASGIYSELLRKHPIQLTNKRSSIKTISATLISLLRDGKIGRLKEKSGQFIYGEISKHFTRDGKPNLLNLKKQTSDLV